jgi:hypothetical protein
MSARVALTGPIRAWRWEKRLGGHWPAPATRPRRFKALGALLSCGLRKYALKPLRRGLSVRERLRGTARECDERFIRGPNAPNTSKAVCVIERRPFRRGSRRAAPSSNFWAYWAEGFGRLRAWPLLRSVFASSASTAATTSLAVAWLTQNPVERTSGSVQPSRRQSSIGRRCIRRASPPATSSWGGSRFSKLVPVDVGRSP